MTEKKIRPATQADMEEILKIYAQARRFMAENGNPTQWGQHHPAREILEEDIGLNRLYVLEDGARLQGVFMFEVGGGFYLRTYRRQLAQQRPLRSDPSDCRCWGRCLCCCAGLLFRHHCSSSHRYPRRQQAHAACGGKSGLLQTGHHLRCRRNTQNCI